MSDRLGALDLMLRMQKVEVAKQVQRLLTEQELLRQLRVHGDMLTAQIAAAEESLRIKMNEPAFFDVRAIEVGNDYLHELAHGLRQWQSLYVSQETAVNTARHAVFNEQLKEKNLLEKCREAETEVAARNTAKDMLRDEDLYLQRYGVAGRGQL